MHAYIRVDAVCCCACSSESEACCACSSESEACCAYQFRSTYNNVIHWSETSRCGIDVCIAVLIPFHSLTHLLAPAHTFVIQPWCAASSDASTYQSRCWPFLCMQQCKCYSCTIYNAFMSVLLSAVSCDACIRLNDPLWLRLLTQQQERALHSAKYIGGIWSVITGSAELCSTCTSTSLLYQG